MKIFLDTADVQEIKKWVPTGIIKGVTTNPTHLSKAGSEPQKVIKEICAMLPEGVISVEVTEVDPEAVYTQARAIAALSDNIAVKIPCDLRYYEVIKKLVAQQVPLNITLVFSATQGMAMCMLGVAYISPFIGRLEDIEPTSGIKLVHDLVSMVRTYEFKTQVLAASIRTVDHLQESIRIGVNCATVPVALLTQALSHQLTDKGIAIFLADWKKLGITKFP